MKKIFVLVALSALAVLAFAEASFQQIESLIEQKQYRAAEQGLVEIIKNHPQSAKAYYAMAQAQAGLGNQDKAQFALDKARGLDPELKFASTSNVQNLQTAITPQAAKIEPVHEHDYSWLKWVLALGVLGLAIWYHESEKAKKKEAEEREKREKAAEEARKWQAEMREKMKTAKNEKEDPKPATAAAPAGPVPSQPMPTYVQPTYAPAPTQSVVHHHHGSSSNDLVNGMVLGQMMSNNHHHDTTRIVEREVIREVPAAPQRDSSWDTPAPSRDSSWDEPAPKKSSSWDSDSSSSSSSSWGSSSSSSSSSSWDSGSSSSDSGSSSSWD